MDPVAGVKPSSIVQGERCEAAISWCCANLRVHWLLGVVDGAFNANLAM